MAILEGTTEDGALVPVQVTDAGRVVAEGLQGPEGPQGPKGDKGDKGDQGDPGSPGDLWTGTDPGPIYYEGGEVGIGNSNPGDYSAVARDLVVGNLSGQHGITIASENNGPGHLRFADGTNNAGQQANGFVQYNHSDQSLRFGVDAEERCRVDSSGRLLVGTSTAIAANPLLQVEQTTGAEIALGRQDTSVVTGDLMGGVGFWGRDTSGVAYTEQASVKCFADGTHDPATNPTRLVFSTTASGSTTPTERLRIDSQGDVTFEGDPIVKSPDGTNWKIVVDNSGNLSAVQ